MEHRRHSGQRRAQAHQKGDQAQVAHGGVSQQALEVVLEDGDEGREQHRDQAHRGDNRLKITRPGQHRVHAHEQENTRLDHGGRVQVGRHGRGRSHRIGQPKMERKLRALGEGPHQNQEQRGQEHRIGLYGGHIAQHFTQLIRARNLTQQHKATQHGQAAAPGHGQGLTGPGACVGPVAPITDQQEGRDAGQLPKHHQEQQVV